MSFKDQFCILQILDNDQMIITLVRDLLETLDTTIYVEIANVFYISIFTDQRNGIAQALDEFRINYTMLFVLYKHGNLLYSNCLSDNYYRKLAKICTEQNV